MSTPAHVPEGATLEELKAAARECLACPLGEPATQTVFGDGQVDARMILVGEQPGDVEDRKGRPFVGPAGRLLDQALAEAGIDRDIAYVTNAVKHFRFRLVGKRRIHQTPLPEHIRACTPWLEAEFTLLNPEVVVALGATAARTLLGPAFRITKSRGQLMPFSIEAKQEEAGVQSAWIIATTHPSAVLRTPPESRQAAHDALVSDLRVAASALA